MTAPRWRRIGAVCLLSASILTACSASAERIESLRGQGASTTSLEVIDSQPSIASEVLGGPGCDPPSLVAPLGLLWEAVLTSENLSGWALIWEKPPLTVGQEVKFVFRVEGSGDLSFRGVDSSGVSEDPTWGPIAHAESTWQRPGDEWGMAFAFPSSGCWSMTVTRNDNAAHLWFEVRP
ncbi:MAG: hypothetical protein ACR2NT_09745 [Acidimicrobiia bacterium]